MVVLLELFSSWIDYCTHSGCPPFFLASVATREEKDIVQKVETSGTDCKVRHAFPKSWGGGRNRTALASTPGRRSREPSAASSTFMLF
eukprot:scaffold8008_cov153-Amphora_coffeaeformis.AAC.7